MVKSLFKCKSYKIRYATFLHLSSFNINGFFNKLMVKSMLNANHKNHIQYTTFLVLIIFIYPVLFNKLLLLLTKILNKKDYGINP